MKIRIELDVCVTFYHKQTMKELMIDKRVRQEYNEESEEYLNLCKERENDIGFPRKEDKEKFDRMFSEMLCKETEQEWNNRLEEIINALKKTYLDDYLTNRTVTGYIELCGYLLNPRDFCAVSIDKFDIRVNKS